MKRNLSILTVILLCVVFLFSSVHAYNPWDHFTGIVTQEAPTEEPVPADASTEEPAPAEAPAENPALDKEKNNLFNLNLDPSGQVPTVTEEPEPEEEIAVTRHDGTLTINSIEIFGSDDSSYAVLEALAGLRLDFSNQTGEVSQSSCILTYNDYELLNYAFQSGIPYYVNCNYLGTDTYMIYEEDQFEEKLMTALYTYLEQFAGESTSSLPSLDEILEMIGTVRESKKGQDQTSSGIDYSNLTETLDLSAFSETLDEVTAGFGSVEPGTGISYSYPDIQSSALYDWPEVSSLPAIPQAVSATEGTIQGKEITKLLNALPQFFEDNPELKGVINQAVYQQLAENYPEYAESEDEDYVGLLVEELQKNLGTSLDDAYLTIRVDYDEENNPILMSFTLGVTDKGITTGIIMTILKAEDESRKAVEVSMDLFNDTDTLPVMRTVVYSDSKADSKQNSFNFRLQEIGTNDIEIAVKSATIITTVGMDFTTSEFNFSAGEHSGSGTVIQTAYANAFDGKDSDYEITYFHNKSGEPLFSINFRLESKATEPQPILTPDDAVAASGLSEEDYDQLAQTVLMQIMMIAMNFMS